MSPAPGVAVGASADARAGAAALIEQIVSHYHETHRRELPPIVALAREVEARGGPPGLADRVRALAAEVEQHMFKEEMRLFPMMEQGGSMLIAQLIDDLQVEHAVHGDEVASLRATLEVLQVPPAAAATLDRLRLALGKFAADLAQHAQIEDEILFPPFVARLSASGT
ncbi:hemerythrin domain-containing protein [Azohydromonas sediminis]|uniref:hemerythrin domain-containing protein n=1 Tax=Azohydromonas sediminis TaxID=2259674 RepID=UPI0013C2D9A3|nr:hemerythrin domain-containing protein [Azohydromonas sediminis]